jgi:hypothetical protein
LAPLRLRKPFIAFLSNSLPVLRIGPRRHALQCGGLSAGFWAWAYQPHAPGTLHFVPHVSLNCPALHRVRLVWGLDSTRCCRPTHTPAYPHRRAPSTTHQRAPHTGVTYLRGPLTATTPGASRPWAVIHSCQIPSHCCAGGPGWWGTHTVHAWEVRGGRRHSIAFHVPPAAAGHSYIPPCELPRRPFLPGPSLFYSAAPHPHIASWLPFPPPPGLLAPHRV